MSPLSGPGRASPEYRPYWQIILLAVILGLASFLGGHTEGQPWGTPHVSSVAFALVVVAICLAFRFLNLSPVVNPLLRSLDQQEPPRSLRERLFWPALGFAGVTASLLLLEKAHPFYFSQDDNMHANLPVMLQGCRNFFAGLFPRWNPYQYMGSPTASVGYYAFTYPLTYTSYWFAKKFIQNPNAMIDVLAFTHLLLGYFAFYWVARRAGCRPTISTLAASCYALSGYSLIFSRSFIQFSSIMLWAPLLLVCLQGLPRGNAGWKWILAFGSCVGLLFHAGHIQMWAYTVLLVNVAVLLLLFTGAIQLRAFVNCLSANLVGLAIASPLLVPELLATHNATRFRDDTGILTGLAGLFLPDSIVHSPHPIGWGAGYPIGEMYYSGTLFILFAAVLLVSILTTRWNKPTVRENIWFLCALLVFLLALGNWGLVWTGLSHLPGFDRFRFPFKFLGLLDLFAILSGAVVLERLARHKRWSLRVEIPLLLLMWGLLAYHCSLATAAFCVYPFYPYPTPDPRVTRFLLPDGDRYYPKVLPVETLPNGELSVMGGSGNRSTDPAFLDSFMNQWPTLAGVFSLTGDDPLVRESPAVQRMTYAILESPVPVLAEYGVNYVLQYNPPGISAGAPLIYWPGTQLVLTTSNVRLYRLSFVRPMVYPLDDPQRALPVKFDVAGASIDTSELPQGATIILNMLWREEFIASGNASHFPVDADAWGRIRITVPAATPSVRVSFRPAWEKGFLAAGLLLVLAAALGLLANRMPVVTPHESL